MQANALSTPEARLNLKPRSARYALKIAPTKSLTYRRRTATSAGRWEVRTKSPDGYSFASIGVADDFGEGLAFADALKKATEFDPEEATTDITVYAALGRWSEAKLLTTTSPKVKRDLEQTPNRLGQHFKGRKLSTVRALDFSRWQKAFLAAKPDTPSRRGTWNRDCAIVKAALTKSANEVGYVGARHWGHVKKLKTGKVVAPRAICLTDNELRRLYAAARPDLSLLMQAASMTACRLGELRDAKVGDLKDDILVVSGKTGERSVPLKPETADFLHHIASGRSQDAALFIRQNGTPWIEHSHIKPMWAAVKASGLPKGTAFYTLRHTTLTRMLERGVSPAIVAKYAGTSIRMLDSAYSHIAANDIRAFL